MKRPLQTLASIAAALSLAVLPACSTTALNDYAAYARPAAALATSTLMDEAVKEGQRADTAARALVIATAVRDISQPLASGAELSKLVTSIAGKDLKWRALGLTLAIAYDRAIAGKYTGQKAILSDIADGVIESLTPYL